jgi:transcriptional regulator with XRE-family HTH domain
MKKLDQNKFNIQLGATVRKFREERELTRPTLSKISGVNEKYIGKIERGECSASAYILKKISSGLEIQLSNLLNEF